MKKFAFVIAVLLLGAACAWACPPVVAAAFVQRTVVCQQYVQPAVIQHVQVLQPAVAVQQVVVQPQVQVREVCPNVDVCPQVQVQPAFVTGAATSYSNGIQFNSAVYGQHGVLSNAGFHASGVRVLNNHGTFGANVAVNVVGGGVRNRVVVRANAGNRQGILQRLFGGRRNAAVVRVRVRG